MFEKKEYSVQMNFAVPDSEKKIAEKAEECLEQLLSYIENTSIYLDLIYGPFSKYQNVDMKMIMKYRKVFRQYRDHARNKLMGIVKKASECISLMSRFRTDTATEELMDSFGDLVDELEKYIDTFVSIFSNLSNPEFRTHLISTIDSVKKQMNQVRQLVTDRILDHIESNILAKNWESNLSEYTEGPIKEHVPLVIQLFRERQKALQDKPEV